MGEFTAKDMFEQLDKKIDKGNDGLHQKMDTFISRMDLHVTRQDERDVRQDGRISNLEIKDARLRGNFALAGKIGAGLVALGSLIFGAIQIF